MKVLIVDDSRSTLLAVERAVAGFGHQCMTAPGGTEAWRLFNEHQFDAVVSDWLMPGVDGLELCRRIRRLRGRSYTYFILLTAVTDKNQLLVAFNAGIDDYLTKPFNEIDLRARLINGKRIRGLYAQLEQQKVELERLNRMLAEEARTDPLTRIGNRRRLREDLEIIHARAKRYGRTYSLAMCDIDWFKQFNDLYGHPAGDSALQLIAKTIVERSREGDGVYRYGGEEIVLVLPEQTLEGAAAAMERIRAAVEALAIPHSSGPAGVLTISVGVAQMQADPATAEAPLAEADEAMYTAKATGRNRVCAFRVKAQAVPA